MEGQGGGRNKRKCRREETRITRGTGGKEGGNEDISKGEKRGRGGDREVERTKDEGRKEGSKEERGIGGGGGKVTERKR